MWRPPLTSGTPRPWWFSRHITDGVDHVRGDPGIGADTGHQAVLVAGLYHNGIVRLLKDRGNKLVGQVTAAASSGAASSGSGELTGLTEAFAEGPVLRGACRPPDRRCPERRQRTIATRPYRSQCAQTIECFWGSKIAVGGYGFIMNDEMHDFSTSLDSVNKLEPGKRPLSTIATRPYRSQCGPWPPARQPPRG